MTDRQLILLIVSVVFLSPVPVIFILKYFQVAEEKIKLLGRGDRGSLTGLRERIENLESALCIKEIKGLKENDEDEI